MGRGGIARPPEAEWSSGVAVFLGGCYNQDILKDPKKRQDYDVSVLYNKDIPGTCCIKHPTVCVRRVGSHLFRSLACSVLSLCMNADPPVL